MNILVAKMKSLDYDKIYLYLIVSFAFTMPLSRAAISFFILLLVFVWIIERNFKKKYEKIKSSKTLLTIILFYCVILFSAIISSNEETASKFIRLYGYWIVIIIIATSLKKEYISAVITSFLLGMFVSEIIAYGVFFELWEFGKATKENPSPFMMHIDYSIFLAFTSILLFNRIISKNYSFKEKFFMILFFCSTTGNLFLSTGRTGQATFIFAVIFMFFLYYKLNIKTILYSFISLLVIYFLAFNLSNSFEKRVYEAKSDIHQMISGNFYSSFGIRASYYMISYDILKDNLIFGVGIGDYKEVIVETLKKEPFNKFPPQMIKMMENTHAHNQFLMVLIQMGLLGMIIVILIFYNLITISLKFSGEHKNIFLLFLVIYFISSNTDPSWYKQFTLVLWVLFAGLISIGEIDFYKSYKKQN